MIKQNLCSGSIGIFDSGIGGLSVWREIVRLLPGEDILYVADQAHVPYGYRSMDEIRTFCCGITDFLLQKGAKLIVIACNAASAAALYYLRELFPHVPFVGMEPAVKPAVKNTKTGVVGVLATQTTFQGKLFESLIQEHGNNTRVLTRIGHGLVEKVEAGALDTIQTQNLLKNCLDPFLDAGADQLVLGCTHYPFLLPIIRRLVGPEVSVIDPAPAVALQTARVINRQQLANRRDHQIDYLFLTSGLPDAFKSSLHRLIPSFAGRFQTGTLHWDSGRLRLGGSP